MTIFSRIRQTRLSYLCHQFKRCYSQISAHSLIGSAPSNKLSSAGLFHHPNCVVHRRPGEIFDNARFFAAPVQIKKKMEEKDTSGPRLNDQIKAQTVRLVTDEGHSVVPLHVALQRAQELEQDLVEVQREPCVVRIMDYHKERYLKQLKEKDKAKTKQSVGTLRKGDNKEVRVSPKCEEKDLKMKADTAKRLMERGYRVKCMVMGTEDQDLGAMLSRFTALIEDVALVESGPRVERKQAYVLVRHQKFGPSKKGGKKATKAAKTDSKESDLEGSEYSEPESDKFDEASSPGDHDSPLPTKHMNSRAVGAEMFDHSGDRNGHSGSMDHQPRDTRQPSNPLSHAQLQLEMENRYSRQGGPQVGPNRVPGQAQWNNNRVNPDASGARLGRPAHLQPGMDNRYSRQVGPQVDPNRGQGQAQWNNNRVNPDASGARPGMGWNRATDGQAVPRGAPGTNTRVDPRINNQTGQDARDPRWNQGVNNQAGLARDPRLNQGISNQAGVARDPRLNTGINLQAGQDARDPRPAFNRSLKPEGSGASNQSTSYGMFSASDRNVATELINRPGSSELPPDAGSKTAPSDIGSQKSRTEGGNHDARSWGIFSRNDTDTKAEKSVNSQAKVHQR